jgi:hypothetical protein
VPSLLRVLRRDSRPLGSRVAVVGVERLAELLRAGVVRFGVAWWLLLALPPRVGLPGRRLAALCAPGIGGKTSKRVGGIMSAGVGWEPEPYESSGVWLLGRDVVMIGTMPFGVLRGDRRVGDVMLPLFSAVAVSGGVVLETSLPWLPFGTASSVVGSTVSC